MDLVTLHKDINGQFIFMEWTNYPKGVVGFRVSASNEDDSTWTVLGTTTNPYFSDVLNFKNSIFLHRVSYKIEALDSGGRVLHELQTDSDKKPPQLVKQTLNILKAQADIVLRNANWSHQAYLLRRRDFGAQCPRCYGPDFQHAKDPACPVCFGTGFDRGFFDPMRMNVMVLSEEIAQRTINEPIPTGSDIVTFVGPSVPALQPNDYLIVDESGRFIVTKTSTRTIISMRSPTTLFVASLLKPTDIIYKYNVAEFVSNISSIRFDEHFNLELTGVNIMPVFGELKLIVQTLDNEDSQVLRGDALVQATSQKLVFRCEDKLRGVALKYRLRLNGIVTEGILQPVP